MGKDQEYDISKLVKGPGGARSLSAGRPIKFFLKEQSCNGINIHLFIITWFTLAINNLFKHILVQLLQNSWEDNLL